MTVIILNIPSNTTEADIRNFVNPTLNKLGFIQIGEILKIEIHNSLNKVVGEIQCHGVIYVDSEKTSQIVITKLHAKPFKNRFVTVRKYFDRSWHNDPRNENYDASHDIKNKRISDRRYYPRAKNDLLSKTPKRLDGVTLFDGMTTTTKNRDDVTSIEFSNLPILIAKKGIVVKIHKNSLIITPIVNSSEDSQIIDMTKIVS